MFGESLLSLSAGPLLALFQEADDLWGFPCLASEIFTVRDLTVLNVIVYNQQQNYETSIII